MRTSGQPSPAFAFWIPWRSICMPLAGASPRLAVGLPFLVRPAVGRLARRAEQVRDHFVAVGGHPDPQPAAEQIEDHPRAGVRLAAAGRPLDRQDGAVEPRGDPAVGLQRRFFAGNEVFAGDETRSVGSMGCRSRRRRGCEARRHASQEVECRTARAVRRETAGRDLLRESEEALVQHLAVDGVEPARARPDGGPVRCARASGRSCPPFRRGRPTVPQNPFLNSSDSAVAGFFGASRPRTRAPVPGTGSDG